MRAVIAAALALSPSLASAQATMVVNGAAPNVLHMGTSIQLETRDALTTERKALKVGQQVEMDVLQPVLLNGQVAIPAGSRAVGEITSVRNKGMWGKSGGITGRVLYVEANGRQIRLNGSFTDRGETGTAGVVAAVAFVPVAGFFVTGTSAKIAPGTHVTAFIGEEVPVQFAEVVAPTAAPVAAAAIGPAAPVAAPVITNTSAPVTSKATPATVQPAVLTKS